VCYRKYEHTKTFGLVNSSTANVIWSADKSSTSRSGSSGRAVVAANEEVLCWDIRKGELLSL
jgi:U3 small nucleolar RNA-associated protein 12